MQLEKAARDVAATCAVNIRVGEHVTEFAITGFTRAPVKNGCIPYKL